MWYDYDKAGNQIHSEDSDGRETWCEYNNKGRPVHWKTSGVYECWYEYDSNGNRIHEKCSHGNEEWYEYDKYGNPIRHIVKKKDERADVYVALLEYYKNSKTLKKETVYTYQY